MKSFWQALAIIFMAFAFTILFCPNAQAQRIELRPGGWYDNVGALTEFNMANSLDLRAYIEDHKDDLCEINFSDPNRDDTACVSAWIMEGKEKGKHLYVSVNDNNLDGVYRVDSEDIVDDTNTYIIDRQLEIFNGMHLKCELKEFEEGRFAGKRVRAVFKQKEGRWRGKFQALKPPQRDPIYERYSDILIEGCGFDYNGNPGKDGSPTQTGKFQAFVSIGVAEKVTMRKNLFFDSQRLKCDERFCQRQQVITFAENILVECNKLIDAGRIKVGVPGRHIVIRNNKLDFINDNGITVVDQRYIAKEDLINGLSAEEVREIVEAIQDPDVSEDILIYGNTIEDPLVTGIFYGADGGEDRPGLTARRITIINNEISGNIASACIRGTFPETVGEIFIANNFCRDIGRNRFTKKLRGIQFNGSNPSTNDGITGLQNFVEGENLDSFGDRGAFDISNAQVCLLDNTVRNSMHAGIVTFRSTVRIDGNNWGDAERLRVVDTIIRETGEVIPGGEVIEISTDERDEFCFIPDFVTFVDDSAADRFDRNDSSNPPENRPDNNIPERAAQIGAREGGKVFNCSRFDWKLVKDFGLGQLWELRVPNLNFHQSDDVDWFNITEVPPSRRRGRCQPRLEILYDSSFEAAVSPKPKTRSLRVLEPERSLHDSQLVGQMIPDAPLWVRLSPNPEVSIGTGAVDDEYDLVLRFFSVKSGIPLLNACPF